MELPHWLQLPLGDCISILQPCLLSACSSLTRKQPSLSSPIPYSAILSFSSYNYVIGAYLATKLSSTRPGTPHPIAAPGIEQGLNKCLLNEQMQEFSRTCNLSLSWQTRGGQHPPMGQPTSCVPWASACLSLCLEHLSLSTPGCQSRSPTAGPNPSGSLLGTAVPTPSSVSAQAMAGRSPLHGSHSRFSTRVTCTEHSLHLTHFSNCPCKRELPQVS